METSSTTRPSSPSATGSQISYPVAVAQCNIRKIQGKFSILVTKSCRKLQSRGINVKDIQTFLVTMYSSPNSKDGSDTVTTVLEATKSLDKIFRALGKERLWDYINYYLLQSIIEEFAGDDDELNGMMEQYQQDLTGYILTLKIQTYLKSTTTTRDGENLVDETVPPRQRHDLFKKLSVKTHANITDHSLSYVTNLWQSLAKQFALPQLAMILHEIAEGCIGITWLIPANLVKYITQMAQETANMFAKEQILRVTLEDRCIYPMETKLASELTLLETEPSLLQSEPQLLEIKTKAKERCVYACMSLCVK